ncbi:MAG: tRNA guanosine(34) transglycosylase Tgt [Clostridiales bacterium]|nr:tRNA guanosine(34) transglycosylase Tgt [Clostridiales bacterium]
MPHPLSYQLLHTCAQTGARRGRVTTPHGVIETPCFMPVGTRATVKTLLPRDVAEAGASIILANTYHLYLRPGHALVREAGGLHPFMYWDRPILTDSGGFQVFSLANINKIQEDGVLFRSHIDGSKHFFTPESVMEVEQALGADIAMCFDECAPGTATESYARAAMERTHRWAARCQAAHTRSDQALFGIVQGCVYPDLRIESAKTLSDMDFVGYGIGGLSVGEPKPVMYEMLEVIRPHMPTNKPRYLMGVGSPDCLLEGVLRGVDMFDCVLQTRIARHGLALTRRGRMNLHNKKYERDFTPIEDGCDCHACRNFSRAYIRHLVSVEEPLAAQLLSIHNLRFSLRLMEDVRAAIEQDRYGDFVKPLLEVKLF